MQFPLNLTELLKENVDTLASCLLSLRSEKYTIRNSVGIFDVLRAYYSKYLAEDKTYDTTIVIQSF